MQALDGSCRTPIAALGMIVDGKICLRGEVLTPDGKHRWRRQSDCAATLEDGIALGAKLGGEIRVEAGPLYSAYFGDMGW